MRHTYSILAATLILAGCRGVEESSMVRVNGESLSREILLRDVEVRIAHEIRQGTTGAALDEVRRQATINVVDQFVKRVLLLAAAEKSGIVVDETEKAAAFERIRGQVERGGKSLEELMNESPLGAEHMKNEVVVGLIISKYLSQTLKGETTVSSEELEAFKQQNAGNLQRPETVRASHILVGFEEGEDDSVRAQKRTKIEDLRGQLVAGANFAELAQEHSSCPSRQRGGDLGEFPRGQMVKPFQDAAFSQAVGEIGPIVETQFGFHIILVKAHNANGMMRDEQIRQALLKHNHQQRLVTHLEALKKDARISYSKEVMAMMRSDTVTPKEGT